MTTVPLPLASRGREYSAEGLLLLAAAVLVVLAPPSMHPASRVLCSLLVVLAAFLPGRVREGENGLSSAVLPWLLAILAGSALSTDPARGLVPAMDVSTAGLAGWLAATRLSRGEKRNLFVFVAVLGALAVGLGFVQVFGGLAGARTAAASAELFPDPDFQLNFMRRLGDGRAFGPFLLPGVFSCFSGMLFFACVERRRGESEPGLRLGWTLAALLFLGGLTLSRSVSGWAAFAAVTAALLITRRGRWFWTAAGSAGLAFVVAWRGLPLVLKESVVQRAGLWQDSLRLGWESRLIGVGPGRLGEALGQSGSAFFARHAHCLPLELFGELGVLGLLVFGWLAWRVLRAFGEGSLGPALLFGLLQSLVDLSFQQAEILFLFFLLWGLSDFNGEARPPQAREASRFRRAEGLGLLRGYWPLILAATAAGSPLLFPDPRHAAWGALGASTASVLVLVSNRATALLAPGKILILLFVWSLLSAWVSGTAGAGAVGLGLCGAALAVMSASAAVLGHPPGRNLLGWGAAWTSALLGLWAGWEWLVEGLPRGDGGFTNPNLMAAALLPGLFFSGTKVLFGSPAILSPPASLGANLPRLLPLILFGPSLLGLVSSGSWSALVAAVAAAAAALILRRGRALPWALALAGAGAASVYWIPTFSRVGDKFSSIRSMIWKGALEASLGNPWFGAGPGQGGWLLLARTPDDHVGPFRYDHWAMDPHSGLLRLGLEAGLPALILGGVFFLLLFLMRFKGALKNPGDPGLSGLSLGVLALCAYGIVEDVFLSPGVLILGAAILGSGLGSLSEERSPGSAGGETASTWLKAAALILACAGPGLARLSPAKSASQPADPSSAGLWMELADARARVYLGGKSLNPKRSLQAAMGDYEKAADLAPRDPYVRLHQGRILAVAAARGDLPLESLPAAWHKFDQAIELSPRVALLPWEAAQAARALGDWGKAEAWLAAAAEVEPNFAAPLRVLVKLRGKTRGGEDPRNLARAEAALKDYAPENDYSRALFEADSAPR